MLKKNRGELILTSILTLLPIIAGLLLWDKLPEQIVTHWDTTGEANGWSSKAFTVFGMPAFLLAMHWVCIVVTLADPKNKYIARKPLWLVVWIIPIISLLISFVIYATALGADIKVDKIITLFLGILFIAVGNYLPKCKQNYTIGIKLPWTIHNEENWNRTHRLAGRVWTIGGALILLTALIGRPVILFFIFAAMILIPTVYSYLYYRKSRS